MAGVQSSSLELSSNSLDEGLLREIIDTTGGALQPFIQEYEKLQHALKKSHDSETRFINKCRDLSKNIQVGHEKAQVLNAMVEEEKKQIESLNAVWK